MSRVLHMAAVRKAFADGAGRRQVLEGVDLDLDLGRIVALQGPSGSGKTTLLNLVSGILSADGGSIRLWTRDGDELALDRLDDGARTRVRRAHLGYVFQFFNLIPTLTVRENVLLPLELNGRLALADRALERLAGLGLGDRFDDFPERLSGGERQRVAIARALAHEPVLVLADEPTGNLDADNAARVADLLWREVRTLGSALLIATHDTAIAARADRVLQMGALCAATA
jgi:putative ABC transport system ATP-binding protein